MGRLVFTPRPAPVSPRLRPAHRVALLLALVDKCHGRRGTLLQLHALDTALIDGDFRRHLAGRDRSGLRPVGLRLDPALNRAVDRAVGEGLLFFDQTATVGLTAAGKDALAAITEAGVLEQERAILSEIRGKLTQLKVGAWVPGA